MCLDFNPQQSAFLDPCGLRQSLNKNRFYHSPIQELKRYIVCGRVSTLAQIGTNGWPGNSIQVPLISRLTNRSFSALLVPSTVYPTTISTPFFLAMVIGLFAICWCSLPPRVMFCKAPHTKLGIFGLVCNFRAAEVK